MFAGMIDYEMETTEIMNAKYIKQHRRGKKEVGLNNQRRDKNFKPFPILPQILANIQKSKQPRLSLCVWRSWCVRVYILIWTPNSHIFIILLLYHTFVLHLSLNIVFIFSFTYVTNIFSILLFGMGPPRDVNGQDLDRMLQDLDSFFRQGSRSYPDLPGNEIEDPNPIDPGPKRILSYEIKQT